MGIRRGKEGRGGWWRKVGEGREKWRGRENWRGREKGREKREKRRGRGENEVEIRRGISIFHVA